MIEIFKIKNIEDISPDCKGHDLVLDSNHLSKYTVKKKDRMGPCPHFWRHCERTNNPYLTKNQVINKDGWVYDVSDVPLKNNSNARALYIELEEKIDFCRFGSTVIAMFQHPIVSYAHVIIKRDQEQPFIKADGIGNGKQIWFDLWTPYHDSVNEAERILTGYSLVSDPSDLQKALEFVERNLAVYKMMIFKQK